MGPKPANTLGAAQAAATGIQLLKKSIDPLKAADLQIIQIKNLTLLQSNPNLSQNWMKQLFIELKVVMKNLIEY